MKVGLPPRGMDIYIYIYIYIYTKCIKMCAEVKVFKRTNKSELTGLHNMHFSPNIIRLIKSRLVIWFDM
jgi:hypothetical protein